MRFKAFTTFTSIIAGHISTSTIFSIVFNVTFQLHSIDLKTELILSEFYGIYIFELIENPIKFLIFTSEINYSDIL